jgi:hypothetical protein
MVHGAVVIRKTGGGDILEHQKLINNDVLKSITDNVCSAVDSLKSVLPEDGPVWLKHVAKT